MPYQPFDLTGKVAMITGGNGGIGLGMADAIAQAGGAVCIWGTNLEKNAAARPLGLRTTAAAKGSGDGRNPADSLVLKVLWFRSAMLLRVSRQTQWAILTQRSLRASGGA